MIYVRSIYQYLVGPPPVQEGQAAELGIHWDPHATSLAEIDLGSLKWTHIPSAELGNPHRRIWMGHDAEGNAQAVLKVAQKNAFHATSLNYGTEHVLNEELAYALSCRLGFTVVPETKVYTREQAERLDIPYSVIRNMPDYVTIQRAVPRGHKDHRATIGLQESLFLARLLGRWDAKRNNCLVDSQGRVWDVDYECIGKQTDSWLREHPLAKRKLRIDPSFPIDQVLDEIFERVVGTFASAEHPRREYQAGQIQRIKEGILERWKELTHPE